MENEQIKAPRKSRVASTRRAQERQALDKLKVSMFFNHAMDIPPHIIPYGMEYRYIRTDILDRPDPGRLPEMMRRGWTVVPADRHPEMSFEDPLGRLTHVKGYIYHKGAILCERPIELGQREYKILEDRNMSDLLNMPGTDNFLGEPSIPGTNQTKTYLTRNATFAR